MQGLRKKKASKRPLFLFCVQRIHHDVRVRIDNDGFISNLRKSLPTEVLYRNLTEGVSFSHISIVLYIFSVSITAFFKKICTIKITYNKKRFLQKFAKSVFICDKVTENILRLGYTNINENKSDNERT